MNKLGSTLLCAALLLLCGSVQAEGAKPSSSNGSAKRSETPAARSQAAIQAAKAQLSWMSLRSDHIFRWLRVARGQGDFRRSRCLDRKVSEAHAVERLGRQELQAIRRAAKQGDGHYGHHLARLQRFGDRSNQLMAAAHRCGQKVSRRQRLPTTYRVKVIPPQLPRETQLPRRSSQQERRRTTAKAR